MKQLIHDITEALKAKLEIMNDSGVFRPLRQTITKFFPDLKEKQWRLVMCFDIKIIAMGKTLPIARLPLASLTTLAGGVIPQLEDIQSNEELEHNIAGLNEHELHEIHQSMKEAMKTPVYKVSFGVNDSTINDRISVCSCCEGTGYIFNNHAPSKSNMH